MFHTIRHVHMFPTIITTCYGVSKKIIYGKVGNSKRTNDTKKNLYNNLMRAV